jgi:cytochrome c-type biogenesis protein
MGLGVPFIVSGALFGAFIGFLKRFKRAFELVEVVGGILLVLMGIFLVLGKITIISSLI